MKLTERIRSDLTRAMKSREAATTGTLRLIQAAIQNEQIALGHDLTDEETEAVIRRAAKQRRDSIEQYEKGGREDLASRERSELALIETYLPAMMTEEETAKAVEEAIRESGATSTKDTGGVMKELMAKHRGRIDGKVAQQAVTKRLSQG
jgi:uncharacterized protein